MERETWLQPHWLASVVLIFQSVRHQESFYAVSRKEIKSAEIGSNGENRNL